MKTNNDIQTSLRLPRALLARIEDAAQAAGHGIGEEIRRWLTISFAEPEDIEAFNLLKRKGLI